MKYHLAIFAKGWLELILAGHKTIESRFTKVRCAPFGQVHEGDIVYLKESGGRVKGMFRVERVETFEDLTEAEIYKLYKTHYEEIFTTAWKESAAGFRIRHVPPAKWLESNHATLIHISNPVKFEEPYPLPFEKRNQHAWVVLEHPLHVCEICEDNYLLEFYEAPDGELLHGSQHFCQSCYAKECAG